MRERTEREERVCVCERGSERETERETEREEREKSVCVCVCERERERERERSCLRTCQKRCCSSPVWTKFFEHLRKSCVESGLPECFLWVGFHAIKQ